MSRTRGKHEAIAPRVAARTGGKRVAPFRARPLGALDVILLFLCATLVLLILVTTALPRLLGCTPYAISSDSMAPLLGRGDLVFARGVEFDTLEAHEIVVFRTESGLVTHRVYAVDAASRTLRTKADAALFLDPRPVTEEELVGRVVYKLPLLGHVSLLLGGEEAHT